MQILNNLYTQAHSIKSLEQKSLPVIFKTYEQYLFTSYKATIDTLDAVQTQHIERLISFLTITSEPPVAPLLITWLTV